MCAPVESNNEKILPCRLLSIYTFQVFFFFLFYFLSFFFFCRKGHDTECTTAPLSIWHQVDFNGFMENKVMPCWWRGFWVMKGFVKLLQCLEQGPYRHLPSLWWTRQDCADPVEVMDIRKSSNCEERGCGWQSERAVLRKESFKDTKLQHNDTMIQQRSVAQSWRRWSDMTDELSYQILRNRTTGLFFFLSNYSSKFYFSLLVHRNLLCPQMYFRINFLHFQKNNKKQHSNILSSGL